MNEMQRTKRTSTYPHSYNRHQEFSGDNRGHSTSSVTAAQASKSKDDGDDQILQQTSCPNDDNNGQLQLQPQQEPSNSNNNNDNDEPHKILRSSRAKKDNDENGQLSNQTITTMTATSSHLRARYLRLATVLIASYLIEIGVQVFLMVHCWSLFVTAVPNSNDTSGHKIQSTGFDNTFWVWFLIITLTTILTSLLVTIVSLIWVRLGLDFAGRLCGRVLCYVMHFLQLGLLWRYFKLAFVYEHADIQEFIDLRTFQVFIQSLPLPTLHLAWFLIFKIPAAAVTATGDGDQVWIQDVTTWLIPLEFISLIIAIITLSQIRRLQRQLWNSCNNETIIHQIQLHKSENHMPDIKSLTSSNIKRRKVNLKYQITLISRAILIYVRLILLAILIVNLRICISIVLLLVHFILTSTWFSFTLIRRDRKMDSSGAVESLEKGQVETLNTAQTNSISIIKEQEKHQFSRQNCQDLVRKMIELSYISFWDISFLLFWKMKPHSISMCILPICLFLVENCSAIIWIHHHYDKENGLQYLTILTGLLLGLSCLILFVVQLEKCPISRLCDVSRSNYLHNSDSSVVEVDDPTMNEARDERDDTSVCVNSLMVLKNESTQRSNVNNNDDLAFVTNLNNKEGEMCTAMNENSSCNKGLVEFIKKRSSLPKNSSYKTDTFRGEQRGQNNNTSAMKKICKKSSHQCQPNDRYDIGFSSLQLVQRKRKNPRTKITNYHEAQHVQTEHPLSSKQGKMPKQGQMRSLEKDVFPLSSIEPGTLQVQPFDSTISGPWEPDTCCNTSNGSSTHSRNTNTMLTESGGGGSGEKSISLLEEHIDDDDDENEFEDNRRFVFYFPEHHSPLLVSGRSSSVTPNRTRKLNVKLTKESSPTVFPHNYKHPSSSSVIYQFQGCSHPSSISHRRETKSSPPVRNHPRSGRTSTPVEIKKASRIVMNTRTSDVSSSNIQVTRDQMPNSNKLGNSNRNTSESGRCTNHNSKSTKLRNVNVEGGSCFNNNNSNSAMKSKLGTIDPSDIESYDKLMEDSYGILICEGDARPSSAFGTRTDSAFLPITARREKLHQQSLERNSELSRMQQQTVSSTFQSNKRLRILCAKCLQNHDPLLTNCTSSLDTEDYKKPTNQPLPLYSDCTYNSTSTSETTEYPSGTELTWPACEEDDEKDYTFDFEDGKEREEDDDQLSGVSSSHLSNTTYTTWPKSSYHPSQVHRQCQQKLSMWTTGRMLPFMNNTMKFPREFTSREYVRTWLLASSQALKAKQQQRNVATTSSCKLNHKNCSCGRRSHHNSKGRLRATSRRYRNDLYSPGSPSLRLESVSLDHQNYSKSTTINSNKAVSFRTDVHNVQINCTNGYLSDHSNPEKQSSSNNGNKAANSAKEGTCQEERNNNRESEIIV